MNKKYMICIVAMLMLISILVGCSGAKENVEATQESAMEITVAQTEIATTAGSVTVGESDEEGISADETENTITATEPVEKAIEDSKTPTTEPVEKATEDNKTPATEPTEGTDETTTPTQAPTEPTEPTQPTQPPQGDASGVCCKYQEYVNMSPASQQAYMQSFASTSDFLAWIMAAEAGHSAHNADNVVEGGNINIGDYMN